MNELEYFKRAQSLKYGGSFSGMVVKEVRLPWTQLSRNLAVKCGRENASWRIDTNSKELLLFDKFLCLTMLL